MSLQPFLIKPLADFGIKPLADFDIKRRRAYPSGQNLRATFINGAYQ